jgi:hypothetical protein
MRHVAALPFFLRREIRTDREVDPVREVMVPLSGIAGAKVRASWWPWSGARLVLTAADLRAVEHAVGKGGLRLLKARAPSSEL